MGYELYGDIGFRFKVLKFWFQSFVFKFWVWISSLGFKFFLKSFYGSSFNHYYNS
jgi:hypothetical protein